MPAASLGLRYLHVLAILAAISLATALLLTALNWPYGATHLMVTSGTLTIALASSLALLGLSKIAIPLALSTAIAALLAIYRKDRGSALVRYLRNAPVQGNRFRGVYVTAGVLGVFLYLFLTNWQILAYEPNFSSTAQDVPLLASIAQSIARGDGLSAPFGDGFTLRYHWLSYGFTGSIIATSGMDAVAALTIAVPLLSTALVIFAAGLMGCLTSNARGAPLAAALGLVFAGGVGVWRFSEVSIWEWSSPSTLMGSALGLSTAALVIAQLKVPWRPGYLILILMSAATTATKSSMGAVLMGSVVVWAFIRFARSPADRKDTAFVAGAITIGTVGAYVIFLAGNNNELGLDDRLVAAIATNLAAPTQIVAEIGVLVAYLLAPTLLWGGILLAAASRMLDRAAVQLAAVAGIAGQVALIALTAPDDNQRFLSAAGLTIAVPVLAAVLFEALRQCWPIPRYVLISVTLWLLVSALVLGWASWEDFFELRPLLAFLPLMALTVGIGTALIAPALGGGSRPGYRIVAAAGVSLMLLGLTVPQVKRLLEEGQFANDAGWHVGFFSRDDPHSDNYKMLTERVREVQSRLGEEDLVALFTTPSGDTGASRWSVYAWNRSVYSTSEADLDRLLSSTDAHQAAERRQMIAEAIPAESLNSTAICPAGVAGILLIDATDAVDLDQVPTFVTCEEFHESQ